jgi:hypothetical protein
MRNKYINADKILYIEEVTSTMVDNENPARFYYWLKLEDGVHIQSDDFTTEVDANLDRASLANRLDNK